MAQRYSCLHSIRTQPSTRELCITYPLAPSSPSRRLVVSYLLLFHVVRFSLFFTILLSSRNLVYHRLPYPFTLSSIPVVSFLDIYL